MTIEIPDKPTALNASVAGVSRLWERSDHESSSWRGALLGSELSNVAWTFLTTLAIFVVFLVQGVLIARILGPLGRGEFGTALFFPRDVLLYAGLLGGIEVVNAVASRMTGNSTRLKHTAARMGIVSGILTGIAAALLAWVMLAATDRMYLLPYCLVCCLFVPIEHVQLTISAVDRGKANYGFYNVNRLAFALSFPLLLTLVYGLGINQWLPVSDLILICGLFLLSRVVGLLPTLRGMSNSTAESSLHHDAAETIPGVWKLLKDGRGYAVSMLATEVFERLDVLLILLLATQVDQVGFYLVAVPVAAILTIAPNALGVFTFNAGADSNRRITLKLAITVMALTALIQLIAAVVYSQLMPWLLLTMFGDKFMNSIPFALWLLPACAIKGFLQAADGYLKGCGRPLVGVWARGLSIFVMLGFVGTAFVWLGGIDQQRLILIPMAAAIGQAISMVIISTVVVLDVIEREKSVAAAAKGGV